MPRPHFLKASIAVFISLLSSSCAITQKYQRPAMPAPPAFKEVAGSDQWKTATPGDGVMKGKWWEIFGDADLNRLEEQVSASNYNVKQLEAEFRESVALISVSRSAYYPTITTAPGITQGDRGPNAGGQPGHGTTSNFSLPFSASWIPDLWNRVGLAIDNANANAQLSAANLENLRLSLQATLAVDYFLLRGSDEQLNLLNDNIDIYQQYLKLTNDRFSGGLAALPDVYLAQTQLLTTQAQAIDLGVTRNQYEHAIAVLTGQAPAGFSVLPALTAKFPTAYGTVGTPYSSAFTAIGGVAPYTFSITTGSLPAGLTFNPSTGAVTGTPTTETPAPGPNVTVTVVDSATPRHTATATGSFTIAAPPADPAAAPAASSQLLAPAGVDYSTLAPPPIPVGLPSTLLERRPDVAAQERSVAAANANIGIARTAWYPELTLSATAGLSSGSLLNLLTWGSRVWSVGPALAQTIFDAGKRKAQLRQAEATYDATADGYRQTVLNAFQQVEDNLSTLRVLAEEASIQSKAVDTSIKSLNLEIELYKAGRDSYLNVVTTQQIELSSARTAVTLHQERMTAAVNLILALGGGWDASALPTPVQLKSPDMQDPAKTVNVAQPPAR